MTVVHVTRPGAALVKKNGRLVIWQDGAAQSSTPLAHVAQIVLYGSVHLTTPLLTHCLAAGVDVCFLSPAGRWRGRLCDASGRDARLRALQYTRCADPAFAREIARAIVGGKLFNQRTFHRRRERGAAAGKAVEALDRLDAGLEKVRGAASVESLRGLEGTGAAVHFSALVERLPVAFGFTGIRSRPARDPVNALLNLAYTLLYHQVETMLYLAGLDPFCGCLHEMRSGHAALASDLVEEWRAVLADTLVVALLNHKELTPADFARLPSGEVRLTPDALRRFLGRWEGRLETSARYAPKNARFTYRQMLELQARHFARVVRGEDPAYVPYRWDS